MINLIIWSKDRAAQLDILLRSWYSRVTMPATLFVIYKSTSENYEKGYKTLIEEYKHVTFINQESQTIKDVTLDIINKNKEKYTGFSTDDTFIYRNFSLSADSLQKIFTSADILSLRLGLNTLVQDCHRGTYQPALNNLLYNDGQIIGWKWTDYAPLDNYGYPCGLDMHIFPSSLLQSLITTEWRTTNELETSLFYQRYSFRPIIYSPRYSVAVNVPINNMSNVTISGQIFSYSIEDLNNKFLEGQRFTYEFNESEIVGCHQELKLKSITL